MEIKNRHIFASALTGRGFVTYWQELFMDCRFLFLLKGGSLQVESLILRLLGLALSDRGCHVNYFHRAEDPLVLEGLLVPSLAVGVLAAEHPAAREGAFLEHLVVKIVNLPGVAVCSSDHYLPSWPEKAVGKLQHHPFCRDCRDEEVTAAGAVGWVQELQERKPYLKRYFAGSITAGGVVDFIDHITGFCRKRYILQGKPGASAAVMREILIDALSRHFLVEAFHSWINPADLVVLVFPEIGVAVVDGTCGCNLKHLPGDTVLEIGEKWKTGGIFCGETEKQDDVKYILTEAGQLLESSQKDLDSGECCFTEEEINPIVTALLQEMLGSAK